MQPLKPIQISGLVEARMGNGKGRQEIWTCSERKISGLLWKAVLLIRVLLSCSFIEWTECECFLYFFLFLINLTLFPINISNGCDDYRSPCWAQAGPRIPRRFQTPYRPIMTHPHPHLPAVVETTNIPSCSHLDDEVSRTKLDIGIGLDSRVAGSILYDTDKTPERKEKERTIWRDEDGGVKTEFGYLPFVGFI